jgi:ATP-binding cassette subfamily F protein 3
MCPADLMLLDEPTNHLDIDALVWLEAWLLRYAGTLIVISHDREFLDAITRTTLHLEGAQLTRYSGNYTAFEEMRSERALQSQANFAKQQERIAHLKKFIDRFKAKASKAKQAQSRVKALARMERIAPVLTSADFQFEFREPVSLPNPMLAFEGVACGYRDGAGRAKTIIQGINRSVLAGQRIGILGANGRGKSTLVKTIARALAPLAGHITEGKGLRIGYFAQQELDVLSLQDGPLMHMVRLARDVGPPGREQELRDYLGSFRFVGDMVTQAVGTLSGGEKARLVLAMLVWQRPNLLLLDEPTNHLDLTTREALSMALNEFEGTVLLVSHDRALLREVCDEFWLVTEGAIKPFDGDLDDYQRWLLEHAREQLRQQAREAARAPSAAQTSAGSAASTAPPGARRDERKAAAAARQKRSDDVKPLRMEQNRIDNRLGVLFAERDSLEAGFAVAGLAPEKIAEAGQRLKLVAEEIERLETRWLELGARIDELTAAVD